MNKKLATVLAATCVLGATTAFAANPFSDVQPSDWAYQAVEQLADEGIIIGYPDGTFGGERNITRYEMAQLVARAMAHEDMANAEQQAQINRLANEFANELNSLGVRVTNLENRLGNVTIKGDARIRWAGTEDNEKFDMRARLNFNAKVADNTSAHARLTTGNFGLDKDDASLAVDRLYVQHKAGDLQLVGGAYAETLGETGYWYDDRVDGVKVAYDNGGVYAVAGYGKFKGTDVSAAIKAENARDLAAETAKAIADSADVKAKVEGEKQPKQDLEKAQKATKEKAAEKDKLANKDEKDLFDFEKALLKANAKKAEVDADQNAKQEAKDAAAKAVTDAQKKVNEQKQKVTDQNKQTAIQQKAKDLFDAENAQADKQNAYNAALAATKAEKEKVAAATKADFDAKRARPLDPNVLEAGYGVLGYRGDNFGLQGVYIHTVGTAASNARIDGIWGVGASVKADMFKLSGDYFTVNGKDVRPDSKFWVARVDVGNLSSKRGTWNIYADYIDAEQFSHFGGTTSNRNVTDNIKGWAVGGAFMIADNTKLEGMYAFDNEDQDGKSYDDYSLVQLVYKF